MRGPTAAVWLLVMLVNTGCASPGPGGFADACAAVEDSTFASLDEGECGLCAGGQVCTCTWHLTFSSNSTWSWQHSDYGMSGSYSCSGMELTPNGAWAIDAQYDPTVDLLTWDGVAYGRGP